MLWGGSDMQQLIGRTYRLGQKLPVVVIFLLLQDSFDEHMLSLTTGKIATTTSLFGDGASFIHLEGNGSITWDEKPARLPVQALPPAATLGMLLELPSSCLTRSTAERTASSHSQPDLAARPSPAAPIASLPVIGLGLSGLGASHPVFQGATATPVSDSTVTPLSRHPTVFESGPSRAPSYFSSAGPTPAPESIQSFYAPQGKLPRTAPTRNSTSLHNAGADFQQTLDTVASKEELPPMSPWPGPPRNLPEAPEEGLPGMSPHWDQSRDWRSQSKSRSNATSPITEASHDFRSSGSEWDAPDGWGEDNHGGSSPAMSPKDHGRLELLGTDTMDSDGDLQEEDTKSRSPQSPTAPEGSKKLQKVNGGVVKAMRAFTLSECHSTLIKLQL